MLFYNIDSAGRYDAGFHRRQVLAAVTEALIQQEWHQGTEAKSTSDAYLIVLIITREKLKICVCLCAQSNTIAYNKITY